WQVFRFATPALMAGNVCLLKHASNVPQCALAIEQIFLDAGFPEGAFQTLLIGSEDVGRLIADDRVRAVTLTGSEKAGQAVASQAGQYIKKSVMELGGSDPFIVMPSADLDKAVAMAVKGRVQNNGQTCIAAKRFIVHEEIYDDFKTRLIEKFKGLTVGDPMNEASDVGPLATEAIRQELDQQVKDSLKKGAVKLCGAELIDGDGYYFQPGLLENVPKDSPAYYDELFGPVGLLFKISNLRDAVDIANDTRFGLGSAIYSQDENEIAYAIDNLDAGCTFVNGIVASNPRLPFGGVKYSGYGRELSVEGMLEFMNIKTIVRV
ncbi:MAG: aldehyde dehydrogenase family protein, partial [Alphaproteobacteria bacterium]|nr:aldehyde dehydrogenase family protein [Alphaproteobacteria bacterium]